MERVRDYSQEISSYDNRVISLPIYKDLVVWRESMDEMVDEGAWAYVDRSSQWAYPSSWMSPNLNPNDTDPPSQDEISADDLQDLDWGRVERRDGFYTQETTLCVTRPFPMRMLNLENILADYSNGMALRDAKELINEIACVLN